MDAGPNDYRKHEQSEQKDQGYGSFDEFTRWDPFGIQDVFHLDQYYKETTKNQSFGSSMTFLTISRLVGWIEILCNQPSRSLIAEVFVLFFAFRCRGIPTIPRLVGEQIAFFHLELEASVFPMKSLQVS